MSNIPNLFNTKPATGSRATGLFTPLQNVIEFNTPNPVEGQDDPPFNVVSLDPTLLVGTESSPYVPSSLPVYIPTLYANVHQIQSSLVNGPLELEITQDNRKYPTVKAVKDYIALQLSGAEAITASVLQSSTGVKISTQVNTTILNKHGNYNYEGGSSPTDGGNINIEENKLVYNFPLNGVDTARNGSVKRIVNASPLVENFPSTGGSLSEVMSVSLYSKNELADMPDMERWFIVQGKKYKAYYFAGAGDYIEMVQYINTKTVNSVQVKEELFFVTNYGGVFRETAVSAPKVI